MKLYEEIKQLISDAEKEAEAFYTKGNKAAGTRLRKAMLEVKNKAHEIRQEVIDRKNQEKVA